MGAAEFVNPGLFDTTAIAYQYDLPTLDGKIGSIKLLSYLNNGTGALATVSDGKFKVMPADSNEWATFTASLKDEKSGAINIPKNLTFVTTIPKIGDVLPTDKLVSWSAKTPVMTKGVPDCVAN